MIYLYEECKHALEHTMQERYWHYWMNVVFGDGRRDCIYCGFAELQYQNINDNQPLKVTLTFHSGKWDELFSKDVSRKDLLQTKYPTKYPIASLAGLTESQLMKSCMIVGKNTNNVYSYDEIKVVIKQLQQNNEFQQVCADELTQDYQLLVKSNKLH